LIIVLIVKNKITANYQTYVMTFLSNKKQQEDHF